jgi:predicted tellurium resistance membrane protein TerC
MDFLSADILISLLTLTFLEIVLGIDNIVFISLVAGRMPLGNQRQVRVVGLLLALVGRLLLLLGIQWVIGLNNPIVTIAEFNLSYRDIILLAGGLFLVGKSTTEIHHKVEGRSDAKETKKALTVKGAIIQIILLDLVFSLDSIITAVGLVSKIWVIITAIILSMIIMLLFAKTISEFINKHPAMKLLAITFLFMIGTVLVVEGLHVHVPKGYIYFSMAFALIIEIVNMRIRKNGSE